jgi:type VI secretion system Hcp family effector
MAENIGLLTATGTTQGKIAASEDKRVEGDLKFSDGCEVWAHTTGVKTPTDPSRLVVTGRASHSVFSMWKPMDSTSPKWFQACSTGEVFPTITLTYNKISAAGKPVKFYSWQLTNAIVVGYTSNVGSPGGTQGVVTSDASLANAAQALHDLERLDFTFETITATHLIANTVATASVIGASK